MTTNLPISVRVLCIEDELTLLADLEEELCAAGYEVRSASSVMQALTVLSDFTPDLVLCDVMLGGDDQPDGYALHQHIRQQRPDLAATPFILLTALGQRSDLLQAKRLGIDDYLVKPVDYDLLLATIAARLASVGRVRGSQAYSHEELLGRMREVFAQLPGAVLLCDGESNLLHANHQAQALMQEHGLWRVDTQGRLGWPYALPAALQTLKRNIAEMSQYAVGARRVQTMEMRRASDAVLLGLLKLDGGEQAQAPQLFALFVCSAQSRPVPEVEALRLLFGLTRSEARVARLLAQGIRSEAVAEELGVSVATVNFHLRNLFQKTGVTRQSELVAQVLAAGWALPEMAGSCR
ncbi:MAG TPA: DNA-binding response regulator [Pseudomonas sp.]|nr:DNA-binding response regulator [Pseudomonas sp.]